MKDDKFLKRILFMISLLLGLNLIWIINAQAGLEAGKNPPAFKLSSLEGKEIALQDFLGKVVVLHLWKCKWNQCRAEIPHLLKIKKQYDADKVVILSINVINKKGQVKAEVKKYNMDYTILLGRGAKITSEYKIKKLPHLFIINQKGVIHTSKRFLKADKIKEALDSIL